jgi:rubrerythrin
MEPAPTDVTSLAVMVGEIRGQMREVVHTLNNVSSKIDGLSKEVTAMGPLAADIAELRGEVKLAQQEISVIKEAAFQRKGATNLIDWIFKNWIGLAGFVAVIAFMVKEWKV